MKHPLKIALALTVTALMAACSAEDMAHFNSGGPGVWASGTSYGSSTSVRTYEPRRCYQTSSTHQTCFN
ncbi:hypothetical protein [Maritimibacter fusiformis]|uniref:hypothetical protein n=1 Tax=Maritimibacter fusiformis TaxID=2603819 RepID=UPI0016529975|nr:hypothetical protein [Maritimibacter fusiformis]HHX91702.1 hypothetical protein [Paracoccus sp. (in: a-proteobacteria)]